MIALVSPGGKGCIDRKVTYFVCTTSNQRNVDWFITSERNPGRGSCPTSRDQFFIFVNRKLSRRGHAPYQVWTHFALIAICLIVEP